MPCIIQTGPQLMLSAQRAATARPDQA